MSERRHFFAGQAPRHTFSDAEFQRMQHGRIFDKPVKVELNDGAICEVGKGTGGEYPTSGYHWFSVPELHRMKNAEVFDNKVELIHGSIWDMFQSTPHHAYVLGVLKQRFSAIFQNESTWVRMRMPVTLTARARFGNEPVPDVTIVKGPIKRYSKRHPSGDEVHLAIEVDQGMIGELRYNKGGLYADAGIPEYWVIDTVRERLEVFTEPRPGLRSHYRRSSIYSDDDLVPIKINGRKKGEISIKQIWH